MGAVVGAAVGGIAGSLFGMGVAERVNQTGQAQVGTLVDAQDSLLTEIAEIVLYPDAWLNTPNDQLGGQPPRVFLGSDKGREILHNLVQMVKYGMVT